MREGREVVPTELGLSPRVATDAIALAGGRPDSPVGARDRLLRFPAHARAADGFFVPLYGVVREFDHGGADVDVRERSSDRGGAPTRPPHHQGAGSGDRGWSAGRGVAPTGGGSAVFPASGGVHRLAHALRAEAIVMNQRCVEEVVRTYVAPGRYLRMAEYRSATARAQPRGGQSLRGRQGGHASGK